MEVGGAGTIFTVKTDGSNFKANLSFDIFNGGFPSAQPVVTGNILYGVGSQAGASGSGTIWQYNVSSGVVTTLFDFIGATGTTSQTGPTLSLDGKTLYGITGQAGPLAQVRPKKSSFH